MASEAAYSGERGQRWSDSNDLVERDERMGALIISIPGGLVQTIHSWYHGSTVEFIHHLWGSKPDTATAMYTVCVQYNRGHDTGVCAPVLEAKAAI